MTEQPGDWGYEQAKEEIEAEDAAKRARSNGHDEEAKTPEPLDFINPTDLADLSVPERRWLVPDWIPTARATALYGPGGEGKTLLAQMLATACAIGKPWLGLPVQRCRSILYFCEDDLDEMHRRQQDINAFYNIDFNNLGDMKWLPRLGHDNVLMTFANGRGLHTRLFEQMLTEAKTFNVGLLITDTLADVFSGNENDRGQARMFVQQTLALIAREIKGAVLALAHPSRAGINAGTGESGSTGWDGAFRSRLYLSTPRLDEGEVSDPNARLLTRKKANYATRDATIEMRWHSGVFVTKQSAGSIIDSIQRRTCERVFLDLLDAVNTEGRYVSESVHSTNYAPRLFALRPDREGYGKADFTRAMQTLFANRKIGPGSYQAPDRHSYTCILRMSDDAAGGAGGCPVRH